MDCEFVKQLSNLKSEDELQGVQSGFLERDSLVKGETMLRLIRFSRDELKWVARDECFHKPQLLCTCQPFSCVLYVAYLTSVPQHEGLDLVRALKSMS